MTHFPNSTSGGIASDRKPSKPKSKGGGAINIEGKAKKGGTMHVKVNVEKIVIGDPKAAGITKPGDSSYRKRG